MQASVDFLAALKEVPVNIAHERSHFATQPIKRFEQDVHLRLRFERTGEHLQMHLDEVQKVPMVCPHSYKKPFPRG